MKALLWISTLLLAAAAWFSCRVEPLDPAGRACDAEHPCAGGRVCVDGRCTEPGEDAGTPEDGGEGGDAGVDGGFVAQAYEVEAPAALTVSQCGALTVRYVPDGGAQPFPGPRTLTVGAVEGDVGLFSDPRCELPLGALQAQGGEVAISAFIAGENPGTRSVEARSAGATGAQDVVFTPLVRAGDCRIPAGARTAACDATPAPNVPEAAFLVFQARTPELADTPEDGNVRCALDAGAGFVECGRAGTVGDVDVRWQVVEHPRFAQVQGGTLPCPAAEIVLSLSPAVDAGSSFVLFAAQESGGGYTREDFFMGTLDPDGSAVRVGPSPGGCGGSVQISAQAVQFEGSSVQRGRFAMAPGAAAFTAPLADAVATGRSFLLYSWGVTALGSASRVCDRSVRGSLATSGVEVSFERGAMTTDLSCDDAALEVVWEVVELPPGSAVQQQQVSATAGETTADVALAAPVDPARTFVFAGGQFVNGQAYGSSTWAGGQHFGDSAATFELVDGGTHLRFTRSTALGDALWSVYVVELGR